ncbi:uncharacterized protein N0V89_006791 [Didymosphaeria variabile]|uniref:Heterokaryon incompatibility domain-containing protein n=1 Tax=Didymosphaeria variabile TaxID=1932322 RepID=A0A9W8XI89_9PLEO|nr:uncharacterized protein N0V89_006791 [Didymosphaeria variabile]KAJ4351449.1 hypothetical protein N0V89_006791 [Didymosphaeria variabile]
MSSTRYEYAPLSRPRQEVRLLRILPGDGDVELTVQHYDIEDCPAYVALSYEWGSEQEPKEIRINERSFQVRQNLWDALNVLRTKQFEGGVFDTESPRFWIDAVCISQAHSAERGHQVSLMGRIYRQASHTIVWLGPEAASSDLGMRLLRDHPADGWASSDRKWSAIKALLNRTYFQRIWIVQEIVLSRRIDLLCGSSICPWDRLASFWESRVLGKNKMADLVQFRITDIKKAVELVVARQQFEAGWYGKDPKFCMLQLLDLSHRRHCSEFRDRVYALLGLLPEGQQLVGLEIDYEVGCEELMIRLEAAIHRDGDATQHYILQAFEQEASEEARGRVAWYWVISEVLHHFSNFVLGGFDRLSSITTYRDGALLLQTIYWIVGGYGVNLFPITKEDDFAIAATFGTNTAYQTAELTCSRREASFGRDTTFTIPCIYYVGMLSYHIELTHQPEIPQVSPTEYVRTERRSLECQYLLQRFNKNAQSILQMRQRMAELESEVSTDLETTTETLLPAHVERAVFANLLARLYQDQMHKSSTYGWPERNAKLDNFLKDDCPSNTDLSTFLSQSLFGYYRMTIVKKSSVKRPKPPKGFGPIQSVKIIEKSEDHENPPLVQRIWVASLFRNTLEQPDSRRSKRKKRN